jgi:hypothetical protein
MKSCLAVIALLTSTLATAGQPDCKAFPHEKIAVDALFGTLQKVADGWQFPLWANQPPELKELLKEPRGSTCWLIRNLKEVNRSHLKLPETRKSRPVWAIRALRYVTGCTDFRARLPSDKMPNPDSTRGQFVLRDNASKVAFFGTSMSSDSVYLAPPEAQRQIIASWQKWYDTEASTFNFGECGEVDDWYF